MFERDSNSFGDCDSRSDCYADSHADPGPHRYTDAEPHRDFDSEPHRYSNPYADSDGDRDSERVHRHRIQRVPKRLLRVHAWWAGMRRVPYNDSISSLYVFQSDGRLRGCAAFPE